MYQINMNRWQNRVAVVTGASAGIGAQIAKDLVKAGLVVAALARRKELIEDYRQKLPADQQKRLHAIRADLTSKESIDEAFDVIVKQLGGVDILINNAGTFRPGQLVSIDAKDLEHVVQLNILGVVYATQRAVQSIKERNVEGHVININSTLGHKIPQLEKGNVVFNIYPATKYAVTAISEVLRQEFSELDGKVKVTSVSPGLTNTEIVPEQMKAAAKVILQPEDVSSAVLFALSTPQTVQVTEISLQPNSY